jgi:hypothetical protein
MQTILDRFKRVVAQENDNQRNMLLLQCPSLWSPLYWPALAEWSSHLDAAAKCAATQVLDNLRYIQSKLLDNPSQFTFGIGPVDSIWSRLERQEISRDQASKLAAAPDIYSELSPVYARCLADFAYRRASAGKWRQAVAFAEILLVSIDARGQDSAWQADQNEIWAYAVIDFVEIAGRALNDVPDGRLFRRAANLGEQLAAQGPPWPGSRDPAEVLHRLGALHLDPYINGRNSSDFQNQMALWRERLDAEFGPTLSAQGDDIYVPPPLVAFTSSTQYFRKAVEARKGALRGVSLKGVAESLLWRTIVGDRAVSLEEVVPQVKEALPLLEGHVAYESQVAQLRSLLAWTQQQIGKSAAAAPSREALSVPQGPLENLIKRMTPDAALALCNSTLASLRSKSPEEALEFWVRMRSLVTDHAPEQLRAGYLSDGRSIVAAAFAEQRLGSLDHTPFSDVAADLKQRASAEHWSSRKLAATLFWLAALSPNFSQESDALPILQEAQRADAGFGADFDDLFRFVGAQLYLGCADSGEKGGDLALAAQNYWIALGYFLEIDLRDNAYLLLRKIAELAPQADAATGTNIVIGLSRYALTLEDKLPLTAVELLYRICRTTFSALTRLPGLNSALLLFFWEVVKGYRYSAMLRQGRRLGTYIDSPEARSILDQIERAENLVPPRTAQLLPNRPIDEETLLAAYIGQGEGEAGSTSEEVLLNLQRRFDDYLNRNLVSAVENTDTSLLLIQPDRIQRALDEQTVLISHYIGSSPTGEFALYTLLLTREDVIVMGGVMPQTPYFVANMSSEGRSVKANLLTERVANLRRHVQDEPGPRVVSFEAAQALEDDLGFYLGGQMPSLLEGWSKAGKNHLCFVPNGPLQFYPYHLMGPVDSPLAQQWTVTCLPSLALLFPPCKPEEDRPAARPIAAFGLDFPPGNPHDLPPLENSSHEARTVAACFGEEAVVNDQATEAALVLALLSSRRVHLSTHGHLPTVAPSFQSLYLHPSSSDDGILHAYEILGLDLSHLELITLSACETALGRFDMGDNLRGLPACLFLAGVPTIIATLWRVEPNTAEIFFSVFYEQISHNIPIRAAFTEAQRETRKSKPQYRDWGAFYLMGRS